MGVPAKGKQRIQLTLSKAAVRWLMAEMKRLKQSASFIVEGALVELDAANRGLAKRRK